MGKTRRIWLSAMAAALLMASGCAANRGIVRPSDARTGAQGTTEVTAIAPDNAAPDDGEAGAATGETSSRPVLGGDEPSKEAAERPAEPAARPGLGTEWGETRTSHISNTTFVRADAATPFATTILHYNDEQGARAMSGAAGFQRTAAQAFPFAGGAVTIGLRGEDGRFLNGFIAGDKRYAIGEAGKRYTIVLRNMTQNRFECVISVDGLDVLDGQAASFSKRGYILDPNGELEIDGFRQSMDEVAAFRFGSVSGSYANRKHGDTRNVGVIGVALFHERGTTLWTPEEIKLRQTANPFPGQPAAAVVGGP